MMICAPCGGPVSVHTGPYSPPVPLGFWRERRGPPPAEHWVALAWGRVFIGDLKPDASHHEARLMFHRVRDAVESHLGPMQDGRQASATYARHMAAFLLRELGLNLSAIGRQLDLDRASVRYGIRRIESDDANYPEVRADVIAIRKVLEK